MTELPPAGTASEMLIKAVHDRLVEQNDLLRQLLERTSPPGPPEQPAKGGGAVLVTEPAPPPRAAVKKAAPAKPAKR